MALALLMGGAHAQKQLVRDCKILVDMYNEMGGREHWPSRWDVSNPTSCCEWDGVNCEVKGTKPPIMRVDSINLQGFDHMTGTIPASIVGLSKLRKLRLKWTGGLSGTIPEDIGKLTDLQELKIGRNKVSGTIPFSLYSLHHLEELYFKQSRMSGSLSQAITALTQLEKLEIAEANFGGTLPAGIGRLSRLSTLTLEDNAWRGWMPVLPDGIVHCELTDKSFSSPYSARISTPLPKGYQGWGERNANFNCPLPPSMPTACQRTIFCVTEPQPTHAPYDEDPEEDVEGAAGPTSTGFGSGLGAGLALMLAVCLTCCMVAFALRKKLLRLFIAAKPMMRSDGVTSETKAGSSDDPKHIEVP